jgi:hypothetical protein
VVLTNRRGGAAPPLVADKLPNRLVCLNERHGHRRDVTSRREVEAGQHWGGVSDGSREFAWCVSRVTKGAQAREGTSLTSREGAVGRASSGALRMKRSSCDAPALSRVQRCCWNRI